MNFSSCKLLNTRMTRKAAGWWWYLMLWSYFWDNWPQRKCVQFFSRAIFCVLWERCQKLSKRFSHPVIPTESECVFYGNLKKKPTNMFKIKPSRIIIESQLQNWNCFSSFNSRWYVSSCIDDNDNELFSYIELFSFKSTIIITKAWNL